MRITLETDDGALIHMTSFGLRHRPADVIAALGRGESVDSFLNRLLAFGTGQVRADAPVHVIEELL